MAKVEIVEKSEDKLIKKNAEITVTDDIGRKITLRRPNMLAEANFKLACGDASSNAAFMNDYIILPWIASIDGEKIIPPVTLTEIKSLIQRLDFEGYNAAIKGFVELIKQDKQNGEEVPELAKK